MITAGTLTVAGNVAAGDGGGISGGFISGPGGDGLYVNGTGSIQIAGTGSISGGTSGINNDPAHNYIGGTGGAGIYIKAGANVSIVDAGAIAGGAGGQAKGYGGNGGIGVFLGVGTLLVSGTVSGGSEASGAYGSGTPGDAVLFGGSAATLEISVGAVFDGSIVGNAAVDDILVLESKGSGTLSGFGTTVTGFTTIDEDASARWTLSGSITGAGSIEIGGGATLTLDGTVSISTLSFAQAGNETLRLENPADFTSTLSGFGSGDTVFLSGIEATSLKYSGHVLTLFDAGGTAVDTLTFDGKYTPADFGLDAVHGGTDLMFAGGGIAHWGFPPAAAALTLGDGPHFALMPDLPVLLHLGTLHP